MTKKPGQHSEMQKSVFCADTEELYPRKSGSPVLH